MKKRIILFALLAVLTAAPCWALEPYSISSGLLQSSGVVGTSGASYALTALEVVTDGTNAATVNAYCGTSNGGTAVAKFVCPGASYFCGVTYEIPISCPNGIYLTISGTGAGAIVGYQSR